MSQRTLPAGFIAPCLPSKTDKLPASREWLHEITHDGFRIIARKSGTRSARRSSLTPTSHLLTTVAWWWSVNRSPAQPDAPRIRSPARRYRSQPSSGGLSASGTTSP
jgi:hypothetical protein